jgi:hypothetical protein
MRGEISLPDCEQLPPELLDSTAKVYRSTLTKAVAGALAGISAAERASTIVRESDR